MGCRELTRAFAPQCLCSCDFERLPLRGLDLRFPLICNGNGKLGDLPSITSSAIYSKAPKNQSGSQTKGTNPFRICCRVTTSAASTASPTSKSSPSSCTWMWPLSSTVVGTYIEHITSRQNLPCSLFCRLSPFLSSTKSATGRPPGYSGSFATRRSGGRFSKRANT